MPGLCGVMGYRGPGIITHPAADAASVPAAADHGDHGQPPAPQAPSSAVGGDTGTWIALVAACVILGFLVTSCVIGVRMCWNAMGVRRDNPPPRLPRFAQLQSNVFCVVHHPDGETCIGKHLKGPRRVESSK